MNEKRIIDFVINELSQDTSGHDEQHAFRVASLARKIAKIEGGNEEIIVTAAYLHDCIDHKLFQDIEGQKTKIQALLTELSYTKEQITEILFILENISFSSGKSHQLEEINAQIVCDADRLDALGAMGIIRTIEFGASRQRKFYNNASDIQAGMSGKYDHISKETSLAHFYEKLLKLKDMMFTQTARLMAEKRTNFMKTFLKEFYEEYCQCAKFTENILSIKK